jgi:uncharacterized membrane protein YqjE
MSDSRPSNQGLWEHAKAVGGLLAASVRNRVELFAFELQEERRRIVETVVLAGLVAALGVFALGLFTFTVLVIFWENGRLPALLGLTAIYICSAILAWRVLVGRIGREKAFSETISELKKDCACLDEQP